MTPIVEAELRAGFAFGTKSPENNELLDKFLMQSSVSMLQLSQDTPRVFAEIYAELRKDGRPIGQNDIWLAALARENQLALLTLDQDFKHVRGLELVN